MKRAIMSILAIACAAPAAAQSQPTAPAVVEFHVGSFRLKPRLNISEIGTDSNIFNDPENPQEDFTATITPRLDVDLDANWGRLRSSTFVDFVYFHESEDERRALLVGGGPLEPELRAWAVRYGDRARIATGVGHADVLTHLNAMDLLAAPSQTTPRWREQFGRMLVEAFAGRVPVVASDSGEIPHVVGDAGVLVPEAETAKRLPATTRCSAHSS